MNVMEIRDTVVATYPTRQPLMIWGDPGLGKTSVVSQAAQLLGIDFIDVRLSIHEPIDMRATMNITKTGEMKWSRPWFIPEKGKGILLLGEIVQAVPSMQAVASQLVLDRRVGEHKLGDGWVVLADGNKPSNRAATHAMPTHIANRFVHLYAEVSVDAWVKWALAAKIDIRLIAFIKFRPALLHAFDPQQKVQAFPSPRSWEFVAKQLTNKTPAKVLTNVVKGAVGDGAAAEFLGFLPMADKIVSADAILMNPKTASIPGETSIRYATVMALAVRANKDNMHHVTTYLNRLSKEAGAADVAVAAMKTIVARDESLSQTRGYIEFSAEHSNIMI